MTIRIICPNCNFSKTIPRDKLRAGVRWATCPVCRQRFELGHLKEKSSLGEEDESPEGKGSKNLSPWEQREKFGVFSSLYNTFVSVLFSPGRFFGSMTTKGGLSEPLAFGILFGSVGTMFSVFWNFLIMPEWLLSGVDFISGHFALYLVFTGILILCPIFVLFKIFLISGLFHLCLIILRGGPKGFEGTFRVTAFSQATQLLDFFPFIGGFASFIWNMIVFITGIARIHDTSYPRVILALILPAVLVMAGISLFLISLAKVFY